jgi:hypothetical protein
VPRFEDPGTTLRCPPSNDVMTVRAGVVRGFGAVVVVLGGVVLAASSYTPVRPFDHPSAYPGEPWFDGGRQLPSSVIDAAAGPAQCGLQSVTFLTLGWPLGTHAQFSTEARQYVRDPRNVVGFRSRLDVHSKLPPDARSTGFRDGEAELYTAPSDVDRAVYIVVGNTVERWPRSDPMTVCS